MIGCYYILSAAVAVQDSCAYPLAFTVGRCDEGHRWSALLRKPWTHQGTPLIIQPRWVEQETGHKSIQMKVLLLSSGLDL